jgi:vacuolar-type H+-ATPase subunit I/STV1
MEQSQLVQRAAQRLRDGIARRETTLDLEAIKAVLVEMAAQKERADTFERRVVKAELESEELARRIGDQSGRLATVAIERDVYSKVINELTKQIQERDARLAKAVEALHEIAKYTDFCAIGSEARKANELARAALAGEG